MSIRLRRSDRAGQRADDPEMGEALLSGAEVVWLHGNSTERRAGLCDLGARLRVLRPDLRIVMTAWAKNAKQINHLCRGCDGVEQVLRDNAQDAQAFLKRWSPSICLWAGGDVMPTLLDRTRAQAMDMVLLDLGSNDLPRAARRRWFLTDPGPQALDRFDDIMVTDTEARDAMRRLGISSSKIDVTAPLRATAMPPGCPQAVLSETADMIAGRPVWLAVHAQRSEFRPILDAHRHALRLAPRLMLVVIPDQPTDIVELERRVALSGLSHVNWSDGGEIETHTQVVISEGGPTEIGLWYRSAPIAFIASSFASGTGGRDPEPAAALGSAVIHGPNIGLHRPSYELLRRAGAARMVLDARTLADAVTTLTAPDIAARMALAGWQAVTEGAPLMDRLIDMVLDRLDRRKVAHARA